MNLWFKAQILKIYILLSLLVTYPSLQILIKLKTKTKNLEKFFLYMYVFSILNWFWFLLCMSYQQICQTPCHWCSHLHSFACSHLSSLVTVLSRQHMRWLWDFGGRKPFWIGKYLCCTEGGKNRENVFPSRASDCGLQ